MTFFNMLHITLEIWGAFFSLVCVGVILVEQAIGDHRGRLLAGMFFLNTILMINDALAWIYRGNPSKTAWYTVRISNFFVFVISPILLAAVFMYFCEILHLLDIQVEHKWKYAIWGIVFADILLILISQSTDFLYSFDENNLYHREGGYIFSVLLVYSLILVFLLFIFRYCKAAGKNLTFLMLLFSVLPVASSLIQLLHYGISLNNMIFTICLLILFFDWELEKTRRYIQQKRMLMDNEIALIQNKVELAEKDAQLARQNEKLMDLNTKIMITQIQPHFLYNTLAAIGYLCEEDPEKAKTAVDYFSSYLRMNLDYLQREKKIPFEKELEHIKSYLWIEQLRFGDNLNVKYDIRWKSFYIPALSLQPLVENAVRHGICKTEDGGTVELAVWKEEKKVIIRISDDGAGFEIEKLNAYEKNHIGIQNVRERLKTLCNGKLEIDSHPGMGTVVKITLEEI